MAALLLAAQPLCAAAPPGIGAIDAAPAATLLLPYFEVDLDDPGGSNTLFSVNNASASAVLAHVVIWSDLSVPVLDFNLYLTGYDIQSISLRDILVNAALPQTASLGQDPADTISPRGAFSQDVNFASCTGQLPPPKLPRLFLDHLQNSLTGRFSTLLAACAGLNFRDRIARGYITVDAVSNCTLRFPGDTGYFASGGTGDATDDNVLWGDFFYVAPGANLASGGTLVHVQADASAPQTSTSGQYTFYGRYVGWTAVDNREPLATNFAFRYLDGAVSGATTDLLVWRDSKVRQGPFPCNTEPSWYTLGQDRAVVFDEAEHVAAPPPAPVSPPAPTDILPLIASEAQRLRVGGALFPVPFDRGWIYLDLNTTVAAAGNNPPADPRAAQAWVGTEMVAQGRFRVGLSAITIDSASRPLHPGFAPTDPNDPLALCQRDSDGDGVPDCFDCRPFDPTVHPGARKIACNGKDNDCSCVPECKATLDRCFDNGDASVLKQFCILLYDDCYDFCFQGPHPVSDCTSDCQVPVCDGILFPDHPHCPNRPDGTTVPGKCDARSTNCRQAACRDGACVSDFLPLTSGPCDDGNACTFGDTCDDRGTCVGKLVPDGDSTPLCGAPAGLCQHQCCQGGKCSTCPDKDGSRPKGCDGIDSNTCLQDSCQGGVCARRSQPRTSGPCLDSDGDPCTSGVCSSSAACVPKPDPKTAGNACASDGNPCTLDLCDATGHCSHDCKKEGVDGCHSTCFDHICTNSAKCFLFRELNKSGSGFTCDPAGSQLRLFALSPEEAKKCVIRDARLDTCSTLIEDPMCSCEAPPVDICPPRCAQKGEPICK